VEHRNPPTHRADRLACPIRIRWRRPRSPWEQRTRSRPHRRRTRPQHRTRSNKPDLPQAPRTRPNSRIRRSLCRAHTCPSKRSSRRPLRTAANVRSCKAVCPHHSRCYRRARGLQPCTDLSLAEVACDHRRKQLRRSRQAARFLSRAPTVGQWISKVEAARRTRCKNTATRHTQRQLLQDSPAKRRPDYAAPGPRELLLRPNSLSRTSPQLQPRP